MLEALPKNIFNNILCFALYSNTSVFDNIAKNNNKNIIENVQNRENFAAEFSY